MVVLGKRRFYRSAPDRFGWSASYTLFLVVVHYSLDDDYAVLVSVTLVFLEGGVADPTPSSPHFTGA